MAHVLADHPARGGARHRGPVPHLRKSASNISSTRWAISAKNGLERRRVNTDRTAIPAPAGRSPRYRGGTRRPDRRAESKARRGRPIQCCEARRGRSRSQSTPAQACADASRQAPTRRSGWRSPSVYVDAEGPAEVPAARRFDSLQRSKDLERLVRSLKPASLLLTTVVRETGRPEVHLAFADKEDARKFGRYGGGRSDEQLPRLGERTHSSWTARWWQRWPLHFQCRSAPKTAACHDQLAASDAGQKLRSRATNDLKTPEHFQTTLESGCHLDRRPMLAPSNRRCLSSADQPSMRLSHVR